MQQARLLDLLKKPEVQRNILGDYRGGYSLGLTLNPENRNQLAIRLRIEADDRWDFPDEIEVDGERIPLIVNPNFQMPTPLPATDPVLAEP